MGTDELVLVTYISPGFLVDQSVSGLASWSRHHSARQETIAGERLGGSIPSHMTVRNQDWDGIGDINAICTFLKNFLPLSKGSPL